MPNQKKVTLNERRKYLQLTKKRYLSAGKLERGRFLDENEGHDRLASQESDPHHVRQPGTKGAS